MIERRPRFTDRQEEKRKVERQTRRQVDRQAKKPERGKKRSISIRARKIDGAMQLSVEEHSPTVAVSKLSH